MKKKKTAAHWQLFLGYMGVLTMMLSCMAVGIGIEQPASESTSDGEFIQLSDGVVEVQGENGDWTPVSGDSTFDLTAELESTDPWVAAGVTFETNESTQIEDGLQVGELVRVQGVILEDGTWLASSIERAEEQVDPIIILIGRVDSVDPWVVNGIELNVTEDTEFQGTIEVGTLVRVEILLDPDGTWEVLSITALEDFEEGADCETVLAQVVFTEGNEIQFAGWPVITLDEGIQIEGEAGGEETLNPGQSVIVVVCPSGEDQVIIVQIIILNNEEDGNAAEGGEKVLVCHKPDKKGGHTISIASPAVPAHLAHGDTLGACP